MLSEREKDNPHRENHENHVSEFWEKAISRKPQTTIVVENAYSLLYSQGGGMIAEERDMDKVIETKEFRVENKKFFFDLKENPKGRYLRITESSGGRSSIVIPEAGLKTFREMLEHFVSEKE
ncbi:MAG: PUR family DNA/RNA-binding protein [Acidobacteriota bacterium]